MLKDAVLDDTETYRYSLIREWDKALGRVCFMMLNPSTADAVSDDPTIRKCIGFAKYWGYGSIEVVNLFAYRTKNPRELFSYDGDAVGGENDFYIRQAVERSRAVVAAWGAEGRDTARVSKVLSLLEMAYCLGRTKKGYPRHPLYLRYDIQPELYYQSCWASRSPSPELQSDLSAK
jgi:hypothetical protein